MKSQPSIAIENGLTAQLMNKVTPMPREWRRTSCNAPKSILTSIGTIIAQISTPTGRLTCASSSRPSARNGPGASCPSAIPATMHSATHNVR